MVYYFSMANTLEPFLNSKKTYEYKYEGLVRVGRELPDLVESAVKLRCTFEITGESPQTFVLQVLTLLLQFYYILIFSIRSELRNIGICILDSQVSNHDIKCTFPLKISNVDFEDFSGIPGKSDFSPSQKLTKRLSAEFSQPIVFEFSKGQITDIRTVPGVSNSVVNIVRGILGFLQVTVKTTQSFYELVEVKYDICMLIEQNTH